MDIYVRRSIETDVVTLILSVIQGNLFRIQISLPSKRSYIIMISFIYTWHEVDSS